MSSSSIPRLKSRPKLETTQAAKWSDATSSKGFSICAVWAWRRAVYSFITLAASSSKRNTSVWRPSVRLSYLFSNLNIAHALYSTWLTTSCKRLGQRTFRLYGVFICFGPNGITMKNVVFRSNFVEYSTWNSMQSPWKISPVYFFMKLVPLFCRMAGRTYLFLFTLEQTSHGVIRQSANSDADGDAADRRRLRRQRRYALRAGVPRWTEGRQLLQRRRQRLRLRRGPYLPDDDDGDWLRPGTTNVVVRTFVEPPTNCHNGRLCRRVAAGCDVAGCRRLTNNAPYVVAVAQRARRTVGLCVEWTRFVRHCCMRQVSTYLEPSVRLMYWRDEYISNTLPFDTERDGEVRS